MKTQMRAFLDKYEHVPIKEHPNTTPVNPLVSVCVQTYQHAAYIEKCLDGILMQRTNFSYEILLGEDASVDGTREYCLEYAKRYPNQIRLFLHNRENNIKMNGLPTGRFTFIYNVFSGRGKYIAICDGDDYWLDPDKLQKQVDFLENQPDYMMVSTDVILIDEQGKPMEDNRAVLMQRKFRKQDITFFDLLNVNLINTLTACVRLEPMKKLVQRVVRDDLPFVFDYWYWLNIALMGKIRIFYEKTAAYRVHSNGISRQEGFLSVHRPMVKYDVVRRYLLENSHEKIKGHADILFKMILFCLLDHTISLRKKIELIWLARRNFLGFSRMIFNKIGQRLMVSIRKNIYGSESSISSN